METLSLEMDRQTKHGITHKPWAHDTATPEVRFSIAHNEEAIFLRYEVKEKQTRATYFNINDAVYEDSCVEFFIAFHGESSYYNLEFNCLGTPRIAYGPDRHNRKFIDPELISNVKSQLKLTKGVAEQVNWTLLLKIPLTVFGFHPGLSLTGTAARLNFYKCGDALPDPHYLSYSNIISATPDFHLPQFFQAAKFSARNKNIETSL